MRRQSPLNAAFRNPTVIGALAVLITILAVFLAYNANHGLPFVQSYRLTAQVPNAAALVPGNEVRIGGVRVGIVESITPVARDDGTYVAELAMKLDKSVEPLPVDSKLIIRARSALGLKYLQITRGTSEEGYPPGAVLPLSAAAPEPVEFDEVLSTFDEPTQENIRENLTEFGNAIAGRGPDINTAIGALKPLLPRLERVMRDISDPQTGIGPFFDALAQSASEVAPVAETQAEMFVDLDTTLAAFADIARPYLQETISRTPVALRTANETLPRIRPFLVNSRKLFVELQPGTAAAAVSADTIASALRVGVPVLLATPELNDQLPPTAAALRRFNDNGTAREGIGRLIDLSEALGPPLRFIAPAQSVCNYATLLFRNGANAASKGNRYGNWQRANALNTPPGPNNEGSPSSAPANGGADPSHPLARANFLHVNPYPNTASPGQSPTECEAGNEPYAIGQQVIGNVAGNQGIRTENQIGFQLRKGGGG
jgi:virulence factor Mce-like protein